MSDKQVKTRKKPAAEPEFSLKAGLDELEQIASVIEEGKVSIEHSVELFERAAIIHAQCKKALEELQHRVEVIKKGEN
jgi:exodeoxyribonuclease VII small subunit